MPAYSRRHTGPKTFFILLVGLDDDPNRFSFKAVGEPGHLASQDLRIIMKYPSECYLWAGDVASLASETPLTDTLACTQRVSQEKVLLAIIWVASFIESDAKLFSDFERDM